MTTFQLTDACLQLIDEGDKSVSVEWTELAGRAFADTIAVLLAGCGQPVVSSVAATVEERSGSARSLVTGTPMTARSAALIDGTSAHALDYDDVDDAIIGHPSAVLVPALLSAGTARGADGASLVSAYRTGVRVGRAVAATLGIRNHYEAGWHSTATIGTIAAAAATAQLWQLPASVTRHALGIAATSAAGSRQGFGSMIKPLHAGTAAANGLFAAQLADAGVTAAVDMLDGPLGFRALHTGARVAESFAITAADAAEFDVAAVNTKLFPCCYYTHSAAEAALELANPGDDEIAEVEVVVQPGCLAPLIHHRPRTGDEAKFSMEFVVAAALLDGHITLSTFDDHRVAGDDVQTLLRRVEVTMAPEPPVGPPRAGEPFAVVTMRHADGTRHTARVDRPLGHASRPLTDSALRAKFDDCVRGADPAAANRAFSALRRVSEARSAVDVVETIIPLSVAKASLS